MSIQYKLSSNDELNDDIKDGWKVEALAPNPFPQPYFYTIISKGHDHEYTIPVLWNYEYHQNGTEIAYKYVQTLRCSCGKEQTR